jgi:hypothetical protein
MECYVITAILNGEQQIREEDNLRRQRERDCGDASCVLMPPWQVLVAWLGHKRETARVTAGEVVIAHGA